MKKYEVRFQVTLSNRETFVECRYVEAENDKQAFIEGRNMAVRDYSHFYSCVVCSSIDHEDSKVIDLSTMNIEEELDKIFNDPIFN